MSSLILVNCLFHVGSYEVFPSILTRKHRNSIILDESQDYHYQPGDYFKGSYDTNCLYWKGHCSSTMKETGQVCWTYDNP